MNWKRLFSTAYARGQENYIDSQKKYELARTILYFFFVISLFLGGYFQSKTRMNLLTVVAILGCLPASKSLVSTIMFMRFHSCPKEDVAEIKKHNQGLMELYDCVFTTYKVNYDVNHLCIRGNIVCGVTGNKKFDDNGFEKHIAEVMKLDGHSNITVKIFHSMPKYLERMEQLKQLENNVKLSNAVNETLLSVML